MADIAPITESDEVIAAALEDAHLPSLIAALVHVTGDESLVTGEIKPAYDFFGDGQGGLTPEQRAATRARALDALKKLRDGAKLPSPPSSDTAHKMMNFVAGAEIPAHYIPFLEERIALRGGDPKAVHGFDAIPDRTKKDFRVLIIGAGMSGILAAIRLKPGGHPLHFGRQERRCRRHLAGQHYPGCRVDNPQSYVFVFVRAEPRLALSLLDPAAALAVFPQRGGQIWHPLRYPLQDPR